MVGKGWQTFFFFKCFSRLHLGRLTVELSHGFYEQPFLVLQGHTTVSVEASKRLN